MAGGRAARACQPHFGHHRRVLDSGFYRSAEIETMLVPSSAAEPVAQFRIQFLAFREMAR
jgi:hypothetical protein